MIPIISPVTGQARNIYYLIQPKAEMTATEDDVAKFRLDLKNQGYQFDQLDLVKSQVGFYNGNLCLVDYSVVKGHHSKN